MTLHPARRGRQRCGFAHGAIEGKFVEVALAGAFPVAKQCGGNGRREAVIGRRGLDEDHAGADLEARWIAFGLHSGQQARDDDRNGQQGGQAKDALRGRAI